MKRRLLWAALVLMMLALLTPPVFDEIKGAWFRSRQPDHVMPEVLTYMESHGLATDLNDWLARAAKPEGWLAAYVTDDVTPVWGSATAFPEPQPVPKVLAASKPELVGGPASAISRAAPDAMTILGTRVKAPDGKYYQVDIAYAFARRPIWTIPQAYAWPVVGVLALVWLALAAWVYLDAREKGSPAAPGWLLLGLVTGPVGLAVWFIYGYTQGAFPLSGIRTCPGCGAEIPRSAAFCVRCGHAVKPACPECRKPVEIDWEYCAGCGRHLAG